MHFTSRVCACGSGCFGAMPRDAGEEFTAIERGRPHAYKHLPGTWLRHRNVAQFERRANAVRLYPVRFQINERDRMLKLFRDTNYKLGQ